MAAPVGSTAKPDERSLLTWLDKIEGEGTRWRSDHDGDWDAYADLFQRAKPLAGMRTNRFLANIIRPTLDRRNALITENKPGISIMSNAEGFDDTSKVLDQIITAGWQTWGIEEGLGEMVNFASVFGCAGDDLPWNRDLAMGMGDIEFRTLDPRGVIFDPNVTKARDMQKAQYIRVESVWSLWDVQANFPGRGMLVKPDEGLSSFANNIKTPVQGANVFQQVATSFKARMARLQEGPVPRVKLREYWIKDPAMTAEGKRVFPLGRQILRAGDVILKDGPNPYNDGLWPVDWLDLSPDLDSAWGRSEVEALRFLQDSMNRIGSLFVENSILGGNLVVVADADAMSNTAINQITNAAGLVITKKFGRTVDWRPPPPMPPHMLAFVQFSLGLIDYLVGLKDGQMEGRGRVELRSGVQLEGLQTAAQTLIRSAARRIEAMLERVGTKIISRIFQFYTSDRMMIYLGPGAKYERYKVEAAKLRIELETVATKEAGVGASEEAIKETIKHRFENAWRTFAFKITPMSTLAATKVARAQLLKQLVDGQLLPRSILLREVGFNDTETLMNEVMAENAKWPMPQPQKPQKQQGGGRAK